MAAQRNRRQTIRSTAERELDEAIEVLGFMKSWLPYGGPDSNEILVEFGLTPAAFGDRLRWAAGSADAVERAEVSPDMLAEMFQHTGSATRLPNPL